MEYQKPSAIVSFLSGKGGAGKTTASLAIGKILADVGFKILLIDFDLATSGASYFFAPKLSDPRRKGIAEVFERLGEAPQSTAEAMRQLFTGLIIPVSKDFDFIPSRAGLGKPSATSVTNRTKEDLVSAVLSPLIESIGSEYDYVFVDNQAGYTSSSAAGATVATKAVIVAESDRISSDAVDNLIALVGSDMPRFRRYLINKVEIREAGDYRSKVEAFKAMNRLPPLPFDFSVRNAFGEREIPVDLENPTSFLIALFASVKELLPEKRDHLEKYEQEKVTKLFDSYQGKIDVLIERRERAQDRIIDFKTLEKRRESESKIFASRMLTLVAASLTGIAAAYSVLKLTPFDLGPTFKVALSAMLAASMGGLLTILLRQRSRRLFQAAELEEERTREELRLRKEIDEIEGELDRYKNLITTRSRELLVDIDRAR